jgi:phosphomannomutase
VDFKPKLVAFDLDGTLAESKQPLSASMGELLARLLSRMPVAILSGASFEQYDHQFFPALPAGAALKNLYIFPDNAAQCYVFDEGAWRSRYDFHFTKEEREHVLAALKTAIAQTNIQALVPATWGEQIQDRGAQITFSALGQEAPVAEKEKWDPTREKRKPLYELLVKTLPGFSIGLNATTSIDITRYGITKAYGIRQLAGLTGISVSEMLYVGDALEEGGNDHVVVETGVRTQSVFGPAETATLITDILNK